MIEGHDRAQRRVLGVLVVVPAFAALAVSYVWPTVWTIQASLTQRTVFASGGGSISRNWRPIWSPLGHSLAYAALVSVGPLVAVLIVAPLLAGAAHGAGRPVRRTVRVVLALATVSVAPLAVVLAWRDAHRLPAVAGDFDWSWPAWVIGFGLATALAATAYLAATPRSGLVLAAIAVCTVLAVALQDFTLTYFRPSLGAPSPMGLETRYLFEFADLGRSSALATVLLAALAGLGLVAALALVVSRLRIAPTDGGPRDDAPSAPYAVGAVVASLVVVGVLAYALWPWLAALVHGEITMPAPGSGTPGILRVATPGRLLVATWGPTLAPALVGCVLATLAGYGIGALRPFGRRSEYALLVFAPWLFVGVGPLMPHVLASRVDAFSSLGTTPPLWVNIPVLFLATVYFGGHRHRPIAKTIAMFLPLLGVAILVSWASLAQDTLWWLAVDNEGRSTVNRVLENATGAFRAPSGHTGIGLASPPPMLLLLAAALIALHLTVLDRLRVVSGPAIDHETDSVSMDG